MATPFFFVNKKGTSKKRPCQDYCYLNNWTVKNAYPLPLISDIMDKVKNAKYFTNVWVTTTFGSTKEMNGKQCLKRNLDYSNCSLCSLDFAILQQRSNTDGQHLYHSNNKRMVNHLHGRHADPCRNDGRTYCAYT